MHPQFVRSSINSCNSKFLPPERLQLNCLAVNVLREKYVEKSTQTKQSQSKVN